MEMRSRPALSCDEMRVFSDLMSRNSFLESSGWTVPRSELNEKPPTLPPELEPLLDLLPERIDMERFLLGGGKLGTRSDVLERRRLVRKP